MWLRGPMPTIGFHCSHEQIAPGRLLRDVQHAEKVGFTAAMSSDHLSPWSERQGESGFAWSFLGAALATTSLPFGVVTAPGQRYHPAITAQAIATLSSMFPGRFWAALGSGAGWGGAAPGGAPRGAGTGKRYEGAARVMEVTATYSAACRIAKLRVECTVAG